MSFRFAALLTLLAITGCASPAVVHRSASGALLHAAVGFSVDTPARAATAAAEGITSTILYTGAPSPHSPLANALRAHGIGVIDGGISSIVFDWECHRTHTVALPPRSYSNNYCRTDEHPDISSNATVLARVSHLLDRDARRSYVTGYWVLDDWASWDNGSGRDLLREIHSLIAQKTPEKPAICGFAGEIDEGPNYFWDPGTAANYSNDACDIVGWYNYSPLGRRSSNGSQLNWTMRGLLPAMSRSLEKRGWRIARTPLMGIGQAWGGSYSGGGYQPGITAAEMQTQAVAFCAFGASIISWYAWDDSEDARGTLTPNDSQAVAEGIAAGLRACKAKWAGPVQADGSAYSH